MRLFRRIHQAVGTAQIAANNANIAARHANQTLILADDLLNDLKDGVTFVLVNKAGGPLLPAIMRFLNGETTELPLGVRMVVEESDGVPR